MISTVNTTSTFGCVWIKADFSTWFQNSPLLPESGCGISTDIRTAAMSDMRQTLLKALVGSMGMSSLHRKECLDYQMNDSNFCKMIRMKRTLCQKYKQAKNGIAESERAFDRLDEAAPADSKTEWLASERTTQSRRINDPAAMDVYEISIKKGELTLAPSKSELIVALSTEQKGDRA